MRIFDNPNGTEIEEYEKQKKSPYGGYVYILEWGDIGVKVGCTSRLSERMSNLRQNARYGGLSIGRVAVSPEHTNYMENENILHTIMDDNRIVHTELFELSMEEAVEHASGLEYQDRTEEINKRIDQYSKCFKQFLKPEDDVCEFDYAVQALLEEPEMCMDRVYKAWLFHVERVEALGRLLDLLGDYKETKWRVLSHEQEETQAKAEDLDGDLPVGAEDLPTRLLCHQGDTG